ncbi:TauD/TfdA family dioxygenase, partial [Crocosphaera sp. XPORK-15E]|uniref:TauD/TfdA family dioxygenase n=1 Tax=Crocosphaera sp. XPORK-15E TaxID=3110247 RepID=UPI003A4E6132
NPQLKDICDRISQWFYDNSYSITLDQGSLLLLNNHRFLHGRSKVWDKNRHLERIWLG